VITELLCNGHPLKDLTLYSRVRYQKKKKTERFLFEKKKREFACVDAHKGARGKSLGQLSGVSDVSSAQ